MYSKVKLMGHPLHPMLVGIPVTLYLVTLVCFCAYAFGASVEWFRIAVYANLAGVVMALVAAVPGFVDWAFGIPDDVPAKATGRAHMALNVLALLVFGFDLILHWQQRFDLTPRVGSSVALALIGVALTAGAGFLGWKMVQTHHVGVDLSPEQEHFEPRPAPKVDRHVPTHGGHRQPVG